MTPDKTAADAEEFIAYAVARGVLRFGEFVTKAGRTSPYFFNAGLFNDGAALQVLCAHYARRLAASGCAFDLLYGPAYKGIALAAGVAIELSRLGHNVPFCFNRKEAKDHGEGGQLIGAPLKGRVMVIDDVISAGTSVRESADIIRAHDAQLVGVIIALDRQERGAGAYSAAMEVTQQQGAPVYSIATLQNLIDYLANQPALREQLAAVRRYRRQYGVFQT